MLTIEHFWHDTGFSPNTAQRAVILHVDGPLYLPAGPGSGKTRVLLWRTLNLIVFHGVAPDAIFLSTFTEKAARQLKEGLRALLGLASNCTGHSLSPEVRETARQQVLMYWRKLNEIALRITDTEVRLSLPQQTSPRGRTFAIEGVVDIVREDERVVMYDIKTHDTEAIKANIDDYERQLNVYAHIWQNLRGQRLDETAVICTQLPEALRQAATARDERRTAHELARWEPVIPIPFEPEHVAETVRLFGAVVDRIEDGAFAPADLPTLQTRLAGTTRTFASEICRRCDTRFSCASYRAYAHDASRGAEVRFRQYFDDWGDEVEQAERVTAGLR